jgi:hypothetical protein
MQRKMAIALAAAILAAVAASPAEAARKHKKKVWKHSAPRQAIVVHPDSRWPYGVGTGAVIRGHLPGRYSAVPFGYGYGRFDADFNAYTARGYGAYGYGRRRPWQH